MGDTVNDTGIQWCDLSWNCLRGCSRVSEGCRNCYAEARAIRFSDVGLPFYGFADIGTRKGAGGWTGKVELIPSKLDEPIRKRRWAEKFAAQHGRKPRVFANSMSDMFHEKLPNETIAAVFGVMAAASWFDFLILTKRAKRMREWFEWIAEQETQLLTIPRSPRIMCRVHALDFVDPRKIGTEPRPREWPLPNVMLGVSAERQKEADERIPELLRCPAEKRFVSYEPALSGIDFAGWIGPRGGWCPEHDFAGGGCIGTQCDFQRQKVDLVIFGGESGANARPCDISWARSTRDQCKAAGVAFFCKQLGKDARQLCGTCSGDELRALQCRSRGTPTGRASRHDPGHSDDGLMPLWLRDSHGADESEWPADLQGCREMPT